jgi:hypothetical protein
MTMRRWITFASAAALLAGASACNDNKGGSSAGTRTSPSATDPQGRRADQPSRLRSDAGTADTATPGSSTSATSPSSPSPSSPSDTSSSPSGSSSGSSSSGSSSGDTTTR